MITQLEELSINAWPSLQTMLYDGWVIRFSNGYTKRANSSNPLYGGVLAVDEKIDACEKLYSDRHIATVFKLTAASYPAGLDRILSARGYVLEPGCAVKTLDLQNGIAKLDDPAIILSSDVSDEWLSAFWQMSDIDERKKGTAEQMLLNIVPPKASRIDLGRREGDHSVRDGGPARRLCRPVRHCDGQGFPQTGIRQAADIGLASMG